MPAEVRTTALMTEMPWLDEHAITALLPMADAVATIEDALRTGFDPAGDPARTAVSTTHGELLLMPSEVGSRVGVKVVSVSGDNPKNGLPRIQAVYVLMDARTMTPIAFLDGTALTSVRTPAVSAAAVRALAVPDASRLVVFGSGPQALGHVQAMRCVRPIEQVVIVGRDRTRAQRLVDRLDSAELAARTGIPAEVGDADIIVCATTAAAPVFDGRLVPNTATIVAVGSHEPARSELDTALMGRSAVVVEDTSTALREAGDVIQAIESGTLDRRALINLADIVTGVIHPPADRPRVFKSVGMAWQDLVSAAEVHRRWRREN
jgi:ornithine cyclodeaminase/alanine dehydrogenase-like protein (mu-crystallin family)